MNFDSYNRYINVNKPQKDWCVDIGLVTANNEFFTVARSNMAKTPYFGISDIVDEKWSLPDDEYFKLLGVYDLGNSSLARSKKLEEILKNKISSGAFSGDRKSVV